MRKQIMLIEMFNLNTMLLEDRMDFLRKTYSAKLSSPAIEAEVQTAPQDVQAAIKAFDAKDKALGDKIIDFIAAGDPDPSKRNAQWLISVLLKGGMKLEDIDGAKGVLVRFAQLKPRLPVKQRDINRFKTVGDLYQALLPYENQPEVVSNKQLARTEDAEMAAQSKIVLNNSEYKILIPLTQAAAIYFGKNTRWCTSATGSTNYFDSYNKKGPLYIILDKKNNNRWQFQFESNSFMDEMDRSISLPEFIAAHPGVADFFENQMGEKIAQLGGWTVTKTAHGLEFSDGPRLQKGRKFFCIYTNENNVVENDRTRESLNKISKNNFPFIEAFDDVTFPLKQILNDMELTTDNTDQPLDHMGLFYADGVWGQLNDVGQKFIQHDFMTAWYKLQTSTHGFYGLSVHDDESYGVSIDLKSKELQTSIGKGAEPRIIDALVELLATGDFASATFYDKTDAQMFTTEQATQIVKANPSLGTPLMVLKIHGEGSEQLRKMLDDECEEQNEEIIEYKGNMAIFAKYKSIDDYISEKGNDEAQWAAKVMSGDEHIDVDVNADDDDKKRLLQSLKPEELLKVGLYLKEKYDEEINEMDEFEPSSISDILELNDTVEDDELNDAFDSAIRSGNEVGTENEIHKTLKSSVEKMDNTYFGDNMDGSFENWETPVYIAVSVARVVEIIEDTDNQGYRGSGLEEINEKIKMDSPYHGWQGYDDEAAKERFDDELYEKDILTHDK
jgi:uncharacterized Ntn-hydrolase superfamily protein